MLNLSDVFVEYFELYTRYICAKTFKTLKMVSTKHCCWQECKSGSRYPDKLPKELQEMRAAALKVFISVPKLSQGLEKCQKWIQACSRENFTTKNITRNTHIYMHFIGQERKDQQKNFQALLTLSYLGGGGGFRPPHVFLPPSWNGSSYEAETF